MTDRGALPYYTAAWVIGCFVFATVAWWQDFRAGALVSVAQLLSIYFISLVVGAPDSLLFAFLLRRVMRPFQTHSIPLWTLAGAALALLVTIALAWLGDTWLHNGIPTVGIPGLTFRAIFLVPRALRQAALWYLPIEGGATAAVLCLVNRAFNRPLPTPAPEPTSSPA